MKIWLKSQMWKLNRQLRALLLLQKCFDFNSVRLWILFTQIFVKLTSTRLQEEVQHPRWFHYSADVAADCAVCIRSRTHFFRICNWSACDSRPLCCVLEQLIHSVSIGQFFGPELDCSSQAEKRWKVGFVWLFIYTCTCRGLWNSDLEHSFLSYLQFDLYNAAVVAVAVNHSQRMQNRGTVWM